MCIRDRPFKVLKFRSMRVDAELDGKPKWASQDDPRVTAVGRWSRKLRIDELPQMLNVFKGEMSFVGPRPERAYFVEQLGGVRVTDAASFFEREACQIRVDSLQPSYLIFGGGFDQSPLRAAVKRAFDLLASGAICLAALPVMLLTALAIKLEDGGPVFYQQERVGRENRPFRVLKFRSMRVDAELDGKPRWAAQDDPRVTMVGRWIRKLRIDELPQMLNVFKGEMSFVGPRPERAFFVEQLCQEIAYYNVRHGIKPGITGLAQVRHGYGASVDDAVRKLQYDLYYVKNNSLFLDLLILIDTVQVVLFGKGR